MGPGGIDDGVGWCLGFEYCNIELSKHSVGMWLISSREETRKWVMAPSDREMHLRCSLLEQQKVEMIEKVALMWPNFSKRAVVNSWEGWKSWERWESEYLGLTNLVQSPDVITLISWAKLILLTA